LDGLWERCYFNGVGLLHLFGGSHAVPFTKWSGVRGVTTARPTGVIAVIVVMRAWAVAFVGSACVVTSICIIIPIVGIVAEKVVIGIIFVVVIFPVLGIFVVVTIVVSGIWVLVGRTDAL
jgi:hypothetical protein